MGFFRNLTTGEIVDQMRQVMRGTGQRVSNIVFMGMGEPLLNYARMMDAVRILGEGPGIAQRRITISTAGWVHGILRLAEERRTVRLAVSLHAASDEKRSVLMPVNRRYPLARLQGALQTYTRAVRRRVTFECVFFDGVNDTPEDIDRLISFARRVPCKINVIPFHPIAFASPAAFASGLRRSPRLDEIVARLRSAGLRVMMRSSAGEDITAACGQLAVKQDRARTGAPRGHVHVTSALPEPSQA
jgi:23S rRNA (adenine2503-C2)-methyltransferase